MPERDALATGVEIRWWGDRARALAIYASGFALLFFVLAFRHGQFQPIHRFLMGSFGAVCAYFAVVRLVNTTRLSIHGERLIVKHSPLPWPGSLNVALSDVEDLAVDPASSRLQLRTVRGEEVAVVDDITRSAAKRLDSELKKLVRAMNQQATGAHG